MGGMERGKGHVFLNKHPSTCTSKTTKFYLIERRRKIDQKPRKTRDVVIKEIKLQGS